MKENQKIFKKLKNDVVCKINKCMYDIGKSTIIDMYIKIYIIRFFMHLYIKKMY